MKNFRRYEATIKRKRIRTQLAVGFACTPVRYSWLYSQEIR